ncbi:MAG: methyl-accepting chemotaxis protein [Proteobacteria bacterium]|nr:methyl-accepting chemotaxis protein [Pseudomonadota bacterium]
MHNTLTFGRRLAIGFGFAAFVLLLVAAVSYKTTNDLIENERLVSHTQEMRTNLVRVVSALHTAETGQRGYILTGREEYLDVYEDGIAAVKPAFDALKQLGTDQSQQQRLSTLEQAVESRISVMRLGIQLRRDQGFEAGQKHVMSDRGREIMQNIRTIVADADRDEAELLARRDAEARDSATFANDVQTWGSLAGLIVIVLIGWFITQSLSRMIGGAVGQIQSSSAELQAAATQQATGAKEQTTATSEITTTVSELLATSRQISESARRVSQIAEQTADGSRKGLSTVESTSESLAGVRRQVDQIVTHMLELGKKSQEIGAVTDIVSELAEQTNILAINATIEAAGAGEAGKRFAVVADEIRKLADRVGGSAKEIRGLIEDVRGAVNTTVMATETGSKSVDAGSRLFGEVAQSFSHISQLVGTTTEAAREIELSTKQQTSAVEQVNIAIANVAQASKETEASSTQTLQTSVQLTGLSKDLLRIIAPEAV